MNMQINNDRPIVVYDAESKKAMGVFRYPSLAAKYIFHDSRKCMRINYSTQKRGTILKSKFPFRVACRFATEEYMNVLGDVDWVIINDFPHPALDMNGFRGETFKKEMYKKMMKKVS